MSDGWTKDQEPRLVVRLGDDPDKGPKLSVKVFLFTALIFFFLLVVLSGALPASESETGGDLVYLMGMTAFCIVLQHEYQPRLRQFGLIHPPLRTRETLTLVGAGLAVTAAELGFIFVPDYVLSIMLPPHSDFTVRLQPLGHIMRHPLDLLTVVVAGPVLEELFTRGYLYLVLRQNWGRRCAALISSVIFAALHIDKPLVAFVTFFLSLIYVYLDNKARSLVPSMAAHASYNLVLSVIMFPRA
jgi:membrane protease YdiL (CAAX protease family)